MYHLSDSHFLNSSGTRQSLTETTSHLEARQRFLAGSELSSIKVDLTVRGKLHFSSAGTGPHLMRAGLNDNSVMIKPPHNKRGISVDGGGHASTLQIRHADISCKDHSAGCAEYTELKQGGNVECAEHPIHPTLMKGY